MSKLLISQYHNEVAKIIRYGGTKKETTIRVAFQNLLNCYCQSRNFLLIPELPYKNQRITPDGTIKDALQLDWGYWESKDEDDNLDAEIEKKFKKGYPNDNILFEDSITAILIQAGKEKMRVSMQDVDALDRILKEFIEYQRPEVEEFYQAINKFKDDLPTIINTLREKIDLASNNNQNFITKRDLFLNLCQDSINPNITVEDVREMMIQHILTEDIFLTIFEEVSFHRDNNIASQLTDLINSFLKGADRKNLLSSIQSYYKVIKTKASQINNHHDKQQFLKVIYENFYKAYNPKSADRLGIVYTPNEIVKFMIESTDFLLHKHFNKLLADPDVEILDPATGTGTFITELIEYLPENKLKYKYQNEIHCNEVSILPYYIANLNIEYTYQQKMQEYLEFHNICFVDTLDHTSFEGKQMDLFAMSLENTVRIKRQNDKKISVIIGNPPYNANQQNENDNNKNREYESIDKRIKATYVKESNAQKMKVYDMYSRFFRWASDRLNENGIIAFITNSSFLKAKGFDGFRKSVTNEFDYIYIIDLGGDIRSGDKTGSVFNIMIGICITFLIKTKSKTNKNKLPCQIMYFAPENCNSGQEKLDFLVKTNFDSLNFERIIPDEKFNWLNLTDNDFNNLIPVASKKNDQTIFNLYSNGFVTNRDEWVYDFDLKNLENKSNFFIEEYNYEVNRWIQYKKDNNYQDIKQESNPIVDQFLAERNLIKWSKMIKRDKLRKGKIGIFDRADLKKAYYRPFVVKYVYFGYITIDIKGSQILFFNQKDNSLDIDNKYINFVAGDRLPFSAIASKNITDLGLFVTDPTQCLPLYSYDKEGKRQENITDWALEKFREYYNNNTVEQASSLLVKSNQKKSKSTVKNIHRQDACATGELITKEDIFYYVYAVLHNPEYRKKYELNLKREFPRIPFYNDFLKWVSWGKKLMELHLNYETIKPYPLKIINVGANGRSPLPDDKQKVIKPKLKADKIKNQIIIDEETILTGIPPETWEYLLGNRSALEWILDQYKEKKPKDPTIAEKFNNYRFADYKEKVIDLLMRVTTVSVETMKIIKEMEVVNSG